MKRLKQENNVLTRRQSNRHARKRCIEKFRSPSSVQVVTEIDTLGRLSAVRQDGTLLGGFTDKHAAGTRSNFLYSAEGFIAEYGEEGNELRSSGYKPDSTWGSVRCGSKNTANSTGIGTIAWGRRNSWWMGVARWSGRRATPRLAKQALRSKPSRTTCAFRGSIMMPRPGCIITSIGIIIPTLGDT